MILTYEEKIELSYLQLKGFNYVVRNESGSVEVFVNKPCREKYGTWVEKAYPMTQEEAKRRRNTDLGDYKNITWSTEPILISSII